MPTGYIYAFLIGYTFAIGWLNVFVGFSDSKTKTYLYFGLLSLFASIFLFAQLTNLNYSEFQGLTDTITIVSACSFYGLFLWFIGEYTRFKHRLIQIFICILVGIVLITFFITRSSSSLEIAWEILAHLTILSISIYGIIGGLQMKGPFNKNWKYIFVMLMGILAILSLVIGAEYAFNFQIIPNPEGLVTLLDFFPIGFSIIIGSKMSHDIIRSYQLEKELKFKDRRWSNLVESIDLLMVQLDPSGKIVWVNSYFKGFTGFSENEILGKNWLEELITSNPKEAPTGSVKEFVKGDNPSFQHEIPTKSGERKIGQWSNISLKNTEGKVTGVINIGIDITDREETLNEISNLKDQIEKENLLLKEKVKLIEQPEEIIGDSDALNYAIQRACQVANTDSSVLLEGETGVGKELFTQLIHQRSLRRHKPLVKVNCASLPKELIESELFGHEKGSFTGAISSRQGRFELAHQGTLFLDEIGEFPLDLQPKLLRVLQSGEFERIGSEKTKKVDVRVISATNRDLQHESDKGLFRQDLFFRLNVYPITIPPLQQRIEDLPVLVRHFVEKIGKKIGKKIKHISKADLKLLKSYHWPGNVRELENVIERAIINSVGDNLRIDHSQLNISINNNNQTDNENSNLSFAETQKQHIIRVLEDCEWKINGENGAAEKLGMPPSTLRSKMKKFGIIRQ